MPKSLECNVLSPNISRPVLIRGITTNPLLDFVSRVYIVAVSGVVVLYQQNNMPWLNLPTLKYRLHRKILLLLNEKINQSALEPPAKKPV